MKLLYIVIFAEILPRYLTFVDCDHFARCAYGRERQSLGGDKMSIKGRELSRAQTLWRGMSLYPIILFFLFMSTCNLSPTTTYRVIVNVFNYPGNTSFLRVSKTLTTTRVSNSSIDKVIPARNFEINMESELPVRLKITLEAFDNNNCLLATGSEESYVFSNSLSVIDVHLMIPTLLSCAHAAPSSDSIAVSPSAGRQSGKSVVAIYGSSFVPGAIVQFDGVNALVISLSPSLIWVSTPNASRPGTVDVVVQQPNGTRLTGLSAYTYVPDNSSVIAAPLAVTTDSHSVADVAVGDFSGDNRPDIAVSIPDSGEIRLFPGTSFGGISPIPIILHVPGVYHLSAGVRGGQGADLVVTFRDSSTTRSMVMIFQGNLFSTDYLTQVVNTATPVGQTLATDLDGDQLYDIIANDDMGTRNCFYVWHPARMEAPNYVYSCTNVLRVSAADYNRDGVLDLLVTCTDAVQRHLGRSSKAPPYFAADGGTIISSGLQVVRFEPIDTRPGVDPYGLVLPRTKNLLYTTRLDNPNFGLFNQIVIAGQVLDTVVADFDRDTVRDAVLTTSNPNQSFLLHGDSANGIRFGQLIDTSYGLARLSAADVNNDGKMDVVGINQSRPNEIVFLFGNQ